VFATGRDNMHMRFAGASRKARAKGAEPLGSYSNYFIGPNEKNWFSGVPQYGSVRYSNVYSGIDVVYHSADHDIEYDFVLGPGANPGLIDIAFDREVRIDAQGGLIAGSLRQHRPRVMQDGGEIDADYEVTANHHVHLKLGRYGRQSPVTIDPVLEFSTYLGGPGNDVASNVKLDLSGNIVVAGSGQTPATPTLDPFQQTNTVPSGAWLLKMTPDGKRVLFYTYLSTGGFAGLDLDRDGSMVVSGGAVPEPSR
jgi:hypothetical protein